MIAVPFIYFSFFLLFILKTKKTFDISAYIATLYLISSFFSILIDVKELRSLDTQLYEITLVPALLYCILLTLTIWPFYKFKSEKIVDIKLYNLRSFKNIVYAFFLSFIIVLLFTFNTIIKILRGNVHQIRLDLNKGEAEIDISFGALQPLFTLANIFGGFSLIMLLFYFYSICFLQNSKRFNFMILVSSLTIVLIGILGVDRSKTVYWLITYGFMLIFFRKYMTKSVKAKIQKVSLIFVGLILSYFIYITISRFGEQDSGTSGGIISYAGQSYINFCFFFDNVEYPRQSLQKVFPWFYRVFMDNGIESTTELNIDITTSTGVSAGVFFTFIGDIMVSSGKFIAIVYCCLFYIISRLILKSLNAKIIVFRHLIFLFCLISIPMLGIFANFYAVHTRTIPFIAFMIYGYILKFKKE